MSERTYLGIRFDVWSDEQAWFWLVLNSRRGACAIGVTAEEADAVREACLSIEEMSSNRRATEDARISDKTAIG